MRKRCLQFIMLLLFMCAAAQAHRPIFSENAATDPNSAVLIDQPDISQVIYREITEEASQVWLAFDVNERFELFIQIGVPAIDRLKEFNPAVLVAGPGLASEAKISFELPPGTGTKDFPTDGVKEPRFFHEHFTGTDSWILRSETVLLPESGRYYVVAYVPSGQKGKLWLSIGSKESFGLAEWMKFGEWKRRIRKFHEVSEEPTNLRIPILSEIADMFKPPASTGGSAKKPEFEKTSAKVQDGVRIHTVETEYQNGRQEIRVLLPDNYNEDKKYRVLYVLPVEKGFDQRYGYGLRVLKQMDVHNRYNMLIVQMGFEKEPWYGDHATDPNTRQASYMKLFVVPFIEKHYSTVKTPEGRLLFGFSKSGWGAFSLILTYPEFFGYAASWDAPMLLDRFHYRMEEVYGTLEQLNSYRPDLLVHRQKRYFQYKTRLVLTGEQDWGNSIPTTNGGSHTVDMHILLDKESVTHVYNNSLIAPHRWDVLWMEPVLETLMQLVNPAIESRMSQPEVP